MCNDLSFIIIYHHPCFLKQITAFSSFSSVESDPDYDPSLYSFHKTEDNEVKNMLCVPVFDVDGKTIAVIQAINKVEYGAVKTSEGLSRRATLSAGKIIIHLDHQNWMIL